MAGDQPQAWSRRRLWVLLAGVCVVGLALLVGLGFAIRTAVVHATRTITPAAATRPAGGRVDRDVLLAEPMLQVAPADALGGAPAVEPAAALTVPNSTRTGPARVVTGFPRTPEGAVGQLAAIEQTVLSEMDVARAGEVHRAWVVPGAVPVDQWPLVRHVQSFLGSAGMTGRLEAGARVTVDPVAAQVKATDGPDWVVVCVLVDVRALVRVESRMAYGYCEAMAWRGGRWMVASPGAAAVAPSTWPGTELAARAGWRTWHVAGE